MDKTFSADELMQRFFDSLIGVNPASKRLGYQLNTLNMPADRKLLAVEAQALQARLAGLQAKQQLQEFAQEHIHEQVSDLLHRRLSNIEQIMGSLFNPGMEFYPVLDALSLRGITVNKLDPVVSRVSWLCEDLIKLVNQPHYRKRTPSASMVKDIKTALRFLGVENLRLIIPVYVMQRSLPFSTEPFTLFKNKLWDYSLATAIATRTLAEEATESPYNAFCAGLFHTLGHLVVSRNYLRIYQQVKQAELLKAQEARDTELIDAIDQLEPDAGFLSNCLQEFAAVLSADITSRWQLKVMPLCQTLDQLAEGIGFAGCSPLTRLVQQAQTYVQWQQLKKQDQIDEATSIAWLNSVKLRPDSIHLLARTNLKRLGTEL